MELPNEAFFLNESNILVRAVLPKPVVRKLILWERGQDARDDLDTLLVALYKGETSGRILGCFTRRWSLRRPFSQDQKWFRFSLLTEGDKWKVLPALDENEKGVIVGGIAGEL